MKVSQLTPSNIHFRPKLIQTKLVNWFGARQEKYPWHAHRKCPYKVWVSEVMLQQTVARVVEPYFLAFIARFPTVKVLSEASIDDVREMVRGLGYYRRFGFMHAASKIIAAQDSIFPATYDDWLALPGIGPYTAAAVTSIAFNLPYAVVDGNVERVYARIFDVQVPAGNQPYKNKLQIVAQHLIDQKHPGVFNEGLMVLGQKVCTPSHTPSCHICPLASICQAKQNKTIHLAPGKKIKPEAVAVKLRLVIPIKSERVGLVARSSNARFLPSISGFVTQIEAKSPHTFLVDGSAKNLTMRTKSIGTIKHTITRHKITADVSVLAAGHHKGLPPMKWYTPAQAERALVSNLDRKALALWLQSVSDSKSDK